MKILFTSPLLVYVKDVEDDDSHLLTVSHEKYFPTVKKAVENSIDDTKGKGFIAYADSKLVKKYVKSACPTVILPPCKGMMFGQCVCEVDDLAVNIPDWEKLLTELEAIISAQYSDGWGECFAQKPIKYEGIGGDEADLFVSFEIGSFSLSQTI